MNYAGLKHYHATLGPQLGTCHRCNQRPAETREGVATRSVVINSINLLWVRKNIFLRILEPGCTLDEDYLSIKCQAFSLPLACRGLSWNGPGLGLEGQSLFFVARMKWVQEPGPTFRFPCQASCHPLLWCQSSNGNQPYRCILQGENEQGQIFINVV